MIYFTTLLKNSVKDFLIILSVFVSMNCFSQNADSILVTEELKDQPLIDVLTHLETKYNIRFYYKLEWLTEDRVSYSFNNNTLQEVVERIAHSQDMDFYIRQRNVVFMPEKDLVRIFGELNGFQNSAIPINYNQLVIVGDPKDYQKNKKTYLSGKVLNGANDESLIGASVIINNTDLYAISGSHGEYKIELRPGIYNITVSSVGFENSENSIELVSSGTFNIELFEKSLKLDQVTVFAQKADRNVSGNQMSVIQLDSRNIKQLPSITGEKDLMKSFTMMPGVQSVGEFGSGINVRGGGEDQNLFLIEGAPVFNTSHLMGLISVVNPDAVTSVTLYKGHIPTEYGERVSSAMDIQISDYEIGKFRCAGGLGIYNSRLSIEGPLFNKKVTYKIGGRTSYSDFLLHKIPDYYLMNSSAKFYDLNALITVNLKKDHLTFFGYYSHDYFNYAHQYLYKYGNTLGSVNWVHRFGESLSSSLLFSYSKYVISSEDYNDSLNTYQLNSGISDLNSKLKLTYTGFKNHKLEAGIQAIKYNIQPGTQKNLIKTNEVPVKTMDENALEFAGFINDVYDITDKISLQLGVRYSLYRYLGSKVIYKYAEGSSRKLSNVSDSTVYGDKQTIMTDQGFEPRLSLKYRFLQSSSIKVSYNRNRQYVSLLSYSSVSSPEDVWKLSDPFIKPVVSDQFAIGYYQNFNNNIIETSVELYYKKLNNLIEYKNGAKLSLNNHVETEIVNAEGTNYGVEFLLKKNAGKVDGWITYTYSRALKQTSGFDMDDQINKNNIYPSQYDKPHDLNIAVNYHVNRRFRLGFNFALTSGRAVALPEYTFKQGRYLLVYYSDRGKYRLPPYHRLDLSISYDESLRKKKFWKGSWTFSVLNLYARKNTYSVFYKKEKPSEKNNYKEYSLYKLYLIGIPMPTLTYNFKF
jgi:hypothetical protein